MEEAFCPDQFFCFFVLFHPLQIYTSSVCIQMQAYKLKHQKYDAQICAQVFFAQMYITSISFWITSILGNVRSIDDVVKWNDVENAKCHDYGVHHPQKINIL